MPKKESVQIDFLRKTTQLFVNTPIKVRALPADTAPSPATAMRPHSGHSVWLSTIPKAAVHARVGLTTPDDPMSIPGCYGDTHLPSMMRASSNGFSSAEKCPVLSSVLICGS